MSQDDLAYKELAGRLGPVRAPYQVEVKGALSQTAEMEEDKWSNVGIAEAFIEERGVHVIVLYALVALGTVFEVMVLFRETYETNLVELTDIF